MKLFWRWFLLFVLFIFYSFGIRFEFLIGASAFLAVLFPQYLELIIFGLFIDVLAGGTFGIITIIFFLMIFFEEFMKKIIEPRTFSSRFLLSFSAASFFTILFFSWRLYLGALFNIKGFLYALAIQALSIAVYGIILIALNFFFNVLSEEKN